MPGLRAGLIALAVSLAVASGAMAKGWSPPAPIVRSDGVTIGTVRVRETPGGLALKLEARGLPSGEIGMHIHDVGRCEGPGFDSAGPHWNPGGRQHGRLNPAGKHAGDLGNLWVAADGSVRMDLLPDPASHAANALDANGAALVIHAQHDDERTDPSGNSGARIACAVLAQPSGERG
jgi:superoxide dismutase, Cu-Zn family